MQLVCQMDQHVVNMVSCSLVLFFCFVFTVDVSNELLTFQHVVTS